MPTNDLTAIQRDRATLVTAVLEWSNAGHALLPIRPDGSKAPAVNAWKAIAEGTEPPPPAWLIDQIESGRCDGIAVVTGTASGEAEVLELEGRAADRLEDLQRYASEIGLLDLFDRLINGCVDSSPSGGFHFHYRVIDGRAKPNTKLARRPNPEKPKEPFLLAETRGQGGYMICSPSFGRTHETGKQYESLVGSPANTPTFTASERDELYRLFSMLDEMPVGGSPGTVGASERRMGPVGERDHDGLSPGDDFNNRADWHDILVGWTAVTTSSDPAGGARIHWRRPGKTAGTSATTSGCGEWLYVFSTSTALPSEQGLSKFAAHTYLNHDGNFKAAAAALMAQGYGQSRGASSGGGSDLLRYAAFPVDALPEPVQSLVREGAAAANCDPAHVAMPALAGLAGAIGNTRQLLLKDSWAVPPTLWTATVGESGCKKSVGHKLAIAPIHAIEVRNDRRHHQQCREYEREVAVWEREMQQWKKAKNQGAVPEKPIAPSPVRVLVDNTTIEALAPLLKSNPRGLLLAKDELKGWLGSFDKYSSNTAGGSDESHWLSMYNGSTMVIDRKTGKHPSIHVPRATVAVSGNIPPGILKKGFNKERRESGLAARFLLACPPKTRVRWSEATVPQSVKQAYQVLFESLYALQGQAGGDGELLPVDVAMNPSAKALYTEFYDRHNTEQADLVGDLAAVWSKLEETAARLALVIHVVRCAAGHPGANPLILDEISMTDAIRLVEWFKHETRRVYTMLAEDEDEQANRRLVEWLDRNGGQGSVREVQQKCGWLKGAGQAEKAMETLVEKGVGAWLPTGDGQPGRPSRRFRLADAGFQRN